MVSSIAAAARERGERSPTCVLAICSQPSRTIESVSARGPSLPGVPALQSLSSRGLNMPEVVTFGPFELDMRTGDLRKHGRRVRLAPQPASLLVLLATRPGQLAWNYLFAGDMNRACEQARATLDLVPGSLQACYVLGLSERALGRHGRAIAAFEKAVALSRDPVSLGYLGHACGVAGRTVEARDAARRACPPVRHIACGPRGTAETSSRGEKRRRRK